VGLAVEVEVMLDRGLQKEILRKLANNFPQFTRLRDDAGNKISENAELYNLYYLKGHGLVETKVDDLNRVPPARITAAGLDFLADDGGLRAILGVVTVRLHDETIRALLLDKVLSSNQPEPIKRKLMDSINGLPAAALTAVAMRAVETGLDHSGDGLQALWSILMGS
jgi:hypothetical protein